MSKFTLVPKKDELYHHGIKGQKWGIRRYQNSDGSLTPEGIKRYGKGERGLINFKKDFDKHTKGQTNPEMYGRKTKSDIKKQKKEFNIAKKSQTSSYSNSYDRMLNYSKKSKVVQERSKELTDLSEKAKKLSLSMNNYEEDDKVYKKALTNAAKDAKKDPEYGKYGEKYDNNLIDYYLYDKGYLKKAVKEVFKNDPDYNKTKKDYSNTIKQYKEKCHEIANEIIGEFGNEKINGLGTDMNYNELVYYALSKHNTMWMFTHEEDIGRK